MSFIDYRLNDCVSHEGFSGGPMWDTTVVPNAGGHEARYANWSMPLYKYTADYNVLDPVEQNEIQTAFLVARGQRDSFRFKDWGDYQGDAEPMGTGDGTATPRQLRKYYTFGPTTFARNILLPVDGTLVVLSNGSPLSVTVDDEGMVTPVSVWPNGQIITATFEFDVRVRFGSDFYPFTMALKDLARVTVDLIEARTP